MDLICLSNGEAPLLGPGFKFHPTEEELISYYLTQKVANRNAVFQAIGEVDFYKCEPWDLPAMAKVRDQGNFYFFNCNDRKYRTSTRTNRATGAGYWKSTGRDIMVIIPGGELLGKRKTLVFYRKSVKTSWIMCEYRLPDESNSDQQQWVVCKVFKKKGSNKMAAELPYLPALPSPGSPGSSSVKPNTVPEPPDHLQGGTPPANPEMTLEQSNTLENLLLLWDIGSLVPMLDINGGLSSEIYLL